EPSAQSPDSTGGASSSLSEKLLPSAPADRMAEPPVSSDAMDPEPASYAGDYPQAPSSTEGDAMAHRAIHLTLQDQLHAALITRPRSQRDRLVEHYVIDALVLDAYLPQPLASLVEAGAFNPSATESERNTALHRVQQLLAPGIAARDLREC